MRKIWVLTLFPEYFETLKTCGVTGASLKEKLECVNIRDYSKTKYKSVDDTPYGGGPGMVMKADILRDALIEGVVQKGGYESVNELHVIYPSPRGKIWNHQAARDFSESFLSGEKDLVFICGRYEGIDERFIEKYVSSFYSVGDYVLSGGELAVMLILDSSLRYQKDVLGNSLSSAEDSFEDGLLEFPQYTKPREFEGLEVPSVLLEGHHQKIKQWQKDQKLAMTKKYRPDLISK